MSAERQTMLRRQAEEQCERMRGRWLEAEKAKPTGAHADVIEQHRKINERHGPLRSLHEAYGLLKEEVDELWEEIRRKEWERHPMRIRAEAIDIAVVALRIIDMVEAGERG